MRLLPSLPRRNNGLGGADKANNATKARTGCVIWAATQREKRVLRKPDVHFVPLHSH
jgi:hypothetical protein